LSILIKDKIRDESQDDCGPVNSKFKLAARLIIFGASLIFLIVGFKNRYGNGFRTSDLLWTELFFDDLIFNGGRLVDWNLSNHTDFFPDKLIALPIWLLTRKLYDLFLVCYAFIGYASWIIVSRFLFNSYLVGTLTTAAMLVLMNFGIASNLFIAPFLPSLHFTAFSIAMILCQIFLKPETKPWPRAASICFLFAIFLSDRLIIIFSFAFIFATIAVSFLSHRRLRRFYLPVGTLLVGTAVIILLHDSIWNRFSNVSSMPSFSLAEILRMHSHQIRTWCVVAFTIVCLALFPWLKGLVRKYPQYQNVSAIWISILIGLWPVMTKSALETRYLFPTVFLGFTSIIYLALKIKPRLAISIFTIPFFALAAFAYNQPPSRITEHPLSLCLRELSKQYPLRSGIGTYWHSHEVNFAGDAETPVRAFTEDLRPYYWVTSIRFYREEFNFLVANDTSYHIDMPLAESILGRDFLTKYNCSAANTDVYVLSPSQTHKMAEHMKQLGLANE
jgi:hypothetical protein